MWLASILAPPLVTINSLKSGFIPAGKTPPKPLHVDHLCMLHSRKLTAGSPENHLFENEPHLPSTSIFGFQTFIFRGGSRLTTVEPEKSWKLPTGVTHTSAPRTRTRLSEKIEKIEG